MLHLLELLQSEIRYRYLPLGDAFLSVSKQHKGIFARYFEQVYEELEVRGSPLDIAWNTVMEEVKSHSHFTEEDIAVISGFTNSGQIYDTAMQVRLIEMTTEKIMKRIPKLQEEYERKGKLYIFLGMFAGMFGVIILV